MTHPAPPQVKKLPMRGNAVLWRSIPGFLQWFKDVAPDLTNVEMQEILYRAYGHRQSVGAIDRLRNTYRAMQNAETRRRAYAKRDAPLPDLVRRLGPSDSTFFVTVKGDCFVTSDWHVPHQKDDLFGRLLEMAEAWNVRKLIINGDFLNEDAFSRHRSHRFQVTWQAEKLAARAVLERLFDVFEEIIYVMDNHDRRLLAAMEEKFRGRLDESDVLELLTHGIRIKKLRPSIDYHYVLVSGPGWPAGGWRITSPKEYRRVKLSLPHRLAQVYHQNILVGGDHLFGVGVDDSTRYGIANSMCLVDPERVPYIQIQDSTYPHWTPGFYLLRGGRLLAFPDHPAFTDWGEAVKIGRALSKR